MLSKIEAWIDETLKSYQHNRISCGQLAKELAGFYEPEFLDKSYYVVVDDIPRPDFPELHEAGLGGFLSLDIQGITYKDTYFILRGCESDMALHFHELVHVLQWKLLGAENFIQRYVQEMNLHGYDSAPLEVMAYQLQRHYENEGQALGVSGFVKQRL